jgi:hypothetical protein
MIPQHYTAGQQPYLSGGVSLFVVVKPAAATAHSSRNHRKECSWFLATSAHS